MSRARCRFEWACVLLFLVGPSVRGEEFRSPPNAFDAYIAEPDPAYTWKIVSEQKSADATTYVIDLTSQSWLTEKDVNRTLWKHWLTVVVPKPCLYRTGFLLIGGGRNGSKPPEGPGRETAAIAQKTRSVVAELRMVPNQPLIFHDDGKERVEDDLIGYCWDQYLKTLDPKWLPRLPMVKSAVRAMDTVTALTKQVNGADHAVDKFVVAGGSKRGWTTWMTGAMDKRVVAIVPIVIDVVNVRASMDHHYGAYGFWAPAIDDYVHHKITDRMDDPRYDKLLQLVDPYSYRDRLTMPKFILNGSGDQFFVPDSSQFYFDQLQGPKYLRYVPNADHGLKGTDAIESIIGFYQTILDQSPMPKIRWSFPDANTIAVESEPAPVEVRMWQAHNPKARDFRLETLGPAYQRTDLAAGSDGRWVAKATTPESGWRAFYIELKYATGAKTPILVSTPVRVVPDKLPHDIAEYRRTLTGKSTSPADEK